jgi:hypothetical protein
MGILYEVGEMYGNVSRALAARWTYHCKSPKIFVGVHRSLWMFSNVIDRGERIVEGRRCCGIVRGDEECQ